MSMADVAKPKSGKTGLTCFATSRTATGAPLLDRYPAIGVTNTPQSVPGHTHNRLTCFS